MGLVAEIAAYLQTGGVGTVGTTIFRHELPETPTICIAVIKDPVDEPSEHVMGAAGSAPAADRERFSVVARDSDRVAAWTTARAVRDALSEQYGNLTNPDGAPTPVRYDLIRCITGPYETDVSGKPNTYEVACRFVATKERS